MVKIIINGEAHDSAGSVLLAINDLKLLAEGKKNVICATEDPNVVGKNLAQEVEKSKEFLGFVDKVLKAKNYLEENHKELFDKIMPKSSEGEADEGEGDEAEELDFSSIEIAKIIETVKFAGLEEDMVEDLDLVGAVSSIDQLITANGGYERIKNYPVFLEMLSKQEVIFIDDAAYKAELAVLKDKISSGEELSTKKEDRLAKLLSDPKIESDRVATMSQKLVERAKTLPDAAVIYVFPIGNEHVEAVAKKTTELAKENAPGVEVQISANRLWDSKEARDRNVVLKESKKDKSDEVAKDFFLSEPQQGGYDIMFAKTFPELKPKTSVASSKVEKPVEEKGEKTI